MSDQVRHFGYCKWFNSVKGFGFLIVEGLNRDVFAHKQQLTKSGITTDLIEGEQVSCIVREGPKGHFAVDIKRESK